MHVPREDDAHAAGARRAGGERCGVPEPDLVRATGFPPRSADGGGTAPCRAGSASSTPFEPRELLGAELARDLAGQLRVEPDQLPAGQTLEGQAPGGVGTRFREDAPEQRAVVVVARHDPEPLHQIAERLAERLVGRERLVGGGIAGDDEHIEIRNPARTSSRASARRGRVGTSFMARSGSANRWQSVSWTIVGASSSRTVGPAVAGVRRRSAAGQRPRTGPASCRAALRRARRARARRSRP